LTKISVVIPLLNESETVIELINQVRKTLEEIESDYEILLIDDGSQDETWELIKKYSVKFTKLKALKLSRNFGHHYAITAGIKYSKGDWVVIMDGDLQDKPENIKILYQKAHEGFDVVFLSRTKRPETGIYLLAQKLFYIILRKLSGLPFESSQANFSIISRKVVNYFNLFPEQARFYVSTIQWLGFRKGSVEAEHGIRFKGKPSYTLRKRFKLAFEVILSFSDRPLKFAVALGLLQSTITLLLFVISTYFTLQKSAEFNIDQIILMTLLFITGILLVVMGILGIYIGRIFNEVKRRPLFVVDESINFDIY
jgi:glycosyltransferase involved in cell wall biosynthesis